MAEEVERMREEMQREATDGREEIATVGGVPESPLQWLFERKEVPKSLKKRVFSHASTKNTRLSDINSENNLRKSKANLDFVSLLILAEKKKEDKISFRNVTDIAEISDSFEANVKASTAGEDSERRMIHERRGKFRARSKYEQEGMEEEK